MIDPNPPPPPVVVTPPPTIGFFPAWVTAVGFLVISLALLLLSVAVLRNPSSAPIAAPDGTGKGPPSVTPPAARTEVARAVVAYRDGLDKRFDEWGDQVDDGKLHNVDTIGTAFRENGLTIANPLHDMILKHCDPAGNVTDRKGLSGELHSVARALRGE